MRNQWIAAVFIMAFLVFSAHSDDDDCYEACMHFCSDTLSEDCKLHCESVCSDKVPKTVDGPFFCKLGCSLRQCSHISTDKAKFRSCMDNCGESYCKLPHRN
nr:uncharacterized protein LOC113694610 [Coffea arabica]